MATPKPPSRHTRTWRLPGAVAVVAVVASLALVLLHDPPGEGRRGAILAGSRTTVLGNVVQRAGHRWTLGAAGDVVVLGAWHCDRELLPALLQRSSGDVWRFEHWPRDGGPTAPRRVDVPDAAALRVKHRGACDHLVVVDPHGRSTVLR